MGVARLALVAVLAVAGAGCLFDEEPAHRGDWSPAISSDGRSIAYMSDQLSDDGDSSIFVTEEGPAPRRVTTSDQHDAFPAWSPDGSRLAFARFREGATASAIYAVNADGTGLSQLVRGDASEPAWSPDGKTLAFTRHLSIADSRIHVVRADGSGEQLLVRNAKTPAWSPDGTKIAFVEELGNHLGSYEVKSRTTRMLVRSRRASAASPTWSPDGTRIAFVDIPADGRTVGSIYEVGSLTEIFVVDADGSHRQRLTTNRSADVDVTWTPDGRLLFASDRDGPYRLYTMRADGSDVRPVLTRSDSR